MIARLLTGELTDTYGTTHRWHVLDHNLARFYTVAPLSEQGERSPR